MYSAPVSNAVNFNFAPPPVYAAPASNAVILNFGVAVGGRRRQILAS